MLAGRYRALDLTDVKGAFCGKMLADLGIDVIKVEPPAGSAERDRAPFYHDLPHRERSLYWFAFNGNKRGITLNLESADGQELCRRLAERADFLIESFPPGYLDRLGLGYRALGERNARLIFTAITPFGQSGPYAQLAANDLTILALGGLLNLNGDVDRAPLRFAVEQTFPQVGAQAAAATMIAHQYRAVSGRGQYIDVAMQEAISETLWLEQHFWDIERALQHREGPSTRRGGVALRIVFPCLDGFVSWRIFVASMGSVSRALVDWMAKEGMAGALVEVDWDARDMNTLQQWEVDAWEELFGKFFRRHTKARLFEESQRRGLMLFPMHDVRDLLRDPQLAARDFWMAVEHPELGATIRYPGRPYHTTASVPRRQRRAPLLGEHNGEIYHGELGLCQADLARLKQAGVI